MIYLAFKAMWKQKTNINKKNKLSQPRCLCKHRLFGLISISFYYINSIKQTNSYSQS